MGSTRQSARAPRLIGDGCPDQVRADQRGDEGMDEEKRLFKRIVQSEQDLDHAAECAEQILTLDLHSSATRADKRLLRCLNTGLIVSYVKPFSGNRGSADVRKSLPSEYIDILSDDHRRLHDQLIASRKCDHAHSDPKGRSVSVEVQKVGDGGLTIPRGRDACAALSRDSVEEVAKLIQRLQAKLSEEHVRIQGVLEAGERF